MIVLDASAVLALLQHEPGGSEVDAISQGAFISAVNYAEVLKRLIQRGMPEKVVLSMARELEIEVIPVDREHAEIAASLWHNTKDYGLSMADRCCLALGIVLKKPVWTADRNMAKLKLPMKIKLIRSAQS